MQIIGNIFLALATFLYVLPLQLLMGDVSKKKDDGGAFWGAVFVFGPMWILLLFALLLTAARGGFDWLLIGRGTQYLLIFLTAVALLVVTLFSFAAKAEHPSHLPWAARPFFGWALYLFPLLTMVFIFLEMNPRFASGLPAMTYRAPFAFIGGVSLLACGGMIGQWIIYSQRQQIARVERAVARNDERDRSIMERVQSLNPTNDFAELLGFANRFENEEIRQVAIGKAQSHPHFRDALVDVLKSWRAETALVYLDACDVSEADKRVLAEPVGTAIEQFTGDVKDAVKRTHTFHADQFDWATRLILSVAERFRGQGVDYLPAIRGFRKAMDAERAREAQFNARLRIDQWLGQQVKN